jgi:hypothetical protein
METAIEAFEHTMGVVLELDEAGVNVDMQDVSTRNRLSSMQLPRDCWVCVHFEDLTEEQRKLVMEKREHLSRCGIAFDDKCRGDDIQWQLDWSFEFSPEEATEWPQKSED